MKEKVKVTHLKPKKILKKERLGKGYTLIDMSTIIGASVNTYRSKENGDRSFLDYEMLLISEALELPIDYLFFIE